MPSISVLCFAAYVLLSSHPIEASPPTTGPLLPRPRNLGDAEPFLNATLELRELFDKAISDTQFAGFSTSNASFSAAITSFSASADNPVLWDYHYLAPRRDLNGTNDISGESQYLVGSVSKVFTDLLVLQSGLNVNAPVAEYLPELNTSSGIHWNSIKVEDLMEHLSGIPQNYGFPEIFSLVPLYQQLGFPPLKTSDFPSCGVIALNAGCNETSLLTALTSLNVHAIFPANFSPAYNNVAFALLGIILSRHTNQTYSSLISSLSVSLGMSSTGSSPGNTSLAVIPPPDPVTGVASSWGSDFGINTPQGGLYSTTNDMAKFMRAILAHDPRILPAPGEIDSWLKPKSMLSTHNLLVGAPWEIYRVAPGALFSSINSTIDLYVKDGGVVGYSSRMILAPSYGVGVIVLTAGPTATTVDAVSEAVLAKIMPAVDAAARRQAERTYVGTYSSGDEQGQMNFTLSIDNGPGLRVEELSKNGSDILSALKIIQQSSVVVASELSNQWRIYPASWGAMLQETFRDRNGVERRVDVEEWRLGFEPTPLVTQEERRKSELLSVGKGFSEMLWGVGRAWTVCITVVRLWIALSVYGLPRAVEEKER